MKHATLSPVRVGVGLTVSAVVTALVITVMVVGPATSSTAAPRSSSASGAIRVPAAAYVPDAPTLQREGWTATATQASPGDPADAALDSNAFSYWVGETGASTPASITIDMRADQVVSGLIYEPPQTPTPEDVIGQYAIGVSNDGVRFTTVATGTWSNTTAVKKTGMDAVDTRFVRLTALTAASGTGTAVAAAELYLQGAPHVAASAASVASATSATSATRSAKLNATGAAQAQLSTNPAVVGQWGPVIGFPVIPVAAALLPNNEMLVWSADQPLTYGSPSDDYTDTAILNLTTGAVSEDTVTNTAHNMFCPGIAILPDGEIMVTGGLSNQQTSIYNPATNTWRAGPQMNIGRGYQGMTTLSNGQAFTLGGSWSGVIGGKLGEIWSTTGNWRELTNVPATPMYTADAQGAYRADNHGWFIATSGGEVLQAGPSKQMNWITTTGAGSITPAGNRGSSGDAMNGNAVYYDTNKVITMGGSPSYQNSTATNQAYQIQINANGTNPTVTQSGSMTYPRAFANSVVLPNGQVVTMGGETYAVPFSDANSVLNPELWDPTTGTFTVMSPQAEPRNYHSVAILLPDGTVFSGGGGLCGTCSTNHPDGQIFTPPYLLNADGTLRTRPTIVSAPTTAATGQTITVTTGGPVSSFSMVRYGESTHSVDNDQRRISLPILSSTGNTYTLAIPSDPGIALPGPYMLFAMDANGTPSISTTISVTNVATQPPATSYGQTIFGDAPAAYWPLNESGGTTAGDLSGNGDTAGYLGGGFTYGVTSPVEGAGGQGVTLNGSTSQIVASQPITNPTTYSEEAWFKTTTTTGGLITGFGTAASGTTSTSRDRLVYMANSGQLFFAVYAGTPVTIHSPLSYNDGKWHHVVATQGPDGMHLYIDGKQVTTNATVTSAQKYLGYWRVGAENLSGWYSSPSSNYFAGSLSDVAFYNTELSSAQVLAHYRASGVGAVNSCASGWSCSDVGGAQPAATDAYSAGTWTETAGGGDIWGTADSFHLVTQSLAGDGTVTAHVTAQQNTSAWAKAGPMIRATTDPGSPYYGAFVTPGNGIAVQWRTAQGGTSSQVTTPGTVPKYLRVARYTTSGTTPQTLFTAYTSPDGTNWTAVPGSTVALAITGPALGGFAITSHNQGVGGAVTLDSVALSATEYPPPGISCPSGWTCGDIGNPAPAGSQSLSGGTWTLQAGGSDIFGTSDSFHFVWQSLATDGSLTARAVSLTSPSAWEKAGAMMRATTDPGSPYYGIFDTTGNGVVVQWRSAQGGTTAQVKVAASTPVYLEVVRIGTSFTAATSTNGTTWTAVPGSTVTVANLSGTLLRGLALTSHSGGNLGTATLDTVTTSP
jgi:galactose oxidase